MNNVQELLNTPMTRTEVENEIQILKALLPISEGSQRMARIEKLKTLEDQMDIFRTGEIIEVDLDDNIDSDNNEYRDRFNRFEEEECIVRGCY